MVLLRLFSLCPLGGKIGIGFGLSLLVSLILTPFPGGEVVFHGGEIYLAIHEEPTNKP